jgi:hypothetical protein
MIVQIIATYTYEQPDPADRPAKLKEGTGTGPVDRGRMWAIGLR